MGIYLGNSRIFNPQVVEVRGTKQENLLISRTLSTYENNEIYTIRNYAFASCTSLQSIDLPNASYIGSYAFYSCPSLQSIDLPNISSIGNYAFYYCTLLPSINLPNVSYIGYGAFNSCYNLLSLYLESTSICTLATSNVFSSTPIAGYTTSTGGTYGSIFVPASLYNNYKTATNWTAFSSRFVSI